ncbi:MAG: carbonate dehydratase [Chlamydiota bacterium]
MEELKHLFENNDQWAKEKLSADPDFFSKITTSQSPKYLWIGCSDSRIPSTEILKLEPGDIFVHRNIANLFPHNDFNCLSVLQYAVEFLKIEHIIVCGHYGCGGVDAAMRNKQFGLVDNWLRNIRDVYFREKQILDSITDEQERHKKLVELNVIYQVMNVCYTTIVQNVWAEEKKLSVHGWVYDVSNGKLKDLNCCVSSINQIDQAYHTLNLH